MTKIKICGITNGKDAMWCTGLGVNYLGFNFYPNSPRKISAKLASQIILKLPPFVQPVGVFVNEEINNLAKIVTGCKLKLVQLHGAESVEYINNLINILNTKNIKVEIIKAIRIESESSLVLLPQYMQVVNYFLLDTYVPGTEGGTGEIFNWYIAIKAKEYGKPIFLAGGLTPNNVRDAITKVDPFAVDVASGVERLPKRKDFDKVKQFVTKCQT